MTARPSRDHPDHPGPDQTCTACLACRLAAGTEPLPGGTIHRTGLWVVEHCVGPLALGTLVVKPLRHVLHVAALTPDESAELGPLLRRVSAAVTAVMRPEQVYVCLWSHAGAVPGHIHFVVQPALRDDIERYGVHGPALQTAMFDAGAVPDEEAVAHVCERMRAELDCQWGVGV
ncbi:hypothetical protein [Streptomyces scabichelini]|uniref:HIT family protein n=1 Tax=Streptomyces scabichelini TaxID=2711217 RepID=UPI0030B9BCA5